MAHLTWIAHQPLWLVTFIGLASVAVLLIAFHRIQLLINSKPNGSNQIEDTETDPHPLTIADDLFLDFDPVTDGLGVGQTEVVSVAICLQVRNDHPLGHTLKDVHAYLISSFGGRHGIAFRDETEFDLRHGDVRLLKIGRVLLHQDEVSVQPRGTFRQRATLDEINETYNPHRDWRRMTVQNSNFAIIVRDSKRGPSFQILITCEDTRAKVVSMEANLGADDPQSWLIFAEEANGNG